MRTRILSLLLLVAMLAIAGGKALLLLQGMHASADARHTPGPEHQSQSLAPAQAQPMRAYAPQLLPVADADKPMDFRRWLPEVIKTAYAEGAPKQDANAVSPQPPFEDVDTDFLANIRAKKEELEEKQRELDAREKALAQAEERLGQRISELQQLANTIQQRLQDEKNIKTKKIKRLAAVYEGMQPDRAAPVIAKMDLATVVKIFLLMDEKKVGKILSFLPPEKAVQISQALTRQISSIQ